MAKFDEQLSRMEYLMGYRMPVNESKASNSTIEYHTQGADGKVYGILKENSKYYIKYTEQGKETISESYNYINGFNSRKENEFKSYNEATKQLELKMMSLNEAYGGHEKTSTYDFTRGSKALATLTEEARKELNRVNQIMENAGGLGIKTNIGDHGNPEGKGTSTGANTTSNNAPFSDTVAEPKMDKDLNATHSDPKTANDDYKSAKVTDAELQSDKMKHGTDTVAKDMENAKVDLDGTSVTTEHPKGAKAVKMNESLEEYEDITGSDFGDEMYGPVFGGDSNHNEDTMSPEEMYGPEPEFEEEPVDPSDFEAPIDEPATDELPFEDVPEEDGIVGTEEDNDLDSLMEEFKSLISGDDCSMTGECGSGKLDVQTCDKMDESCEDGSCTSEPKDTEDAMTGPHVGGETLSWQKMNESQRVRIDSLIDNVCNKLNESRKPMTNEEKLQNVINRLVKEEVTKLSDWGKHPRYGAEPMTTPENPSGDGKKVGTADKDWNDASAKGSERYGKKIGSSAPFDQVVNMLTDSVLQMVKESLGLKKK